MQLRDVRCLPGSDNLIAYKVTITNSRVTGIGRSVTRTAQVDPQRTYSASRVELTTPPVILASVRDVGLIA